ncbi:hypothetical protein [Bradyrhizobium sp. USDA 4486]
MNRTAQIFGKFQSNDLMNSDGAGHPGNVMYRCRRCAAHFTVERFEYREAAAGLQLLTERAAAAELQSWVNGCCDAARPHG